MEIKDGKIAISAKTREEWRYWLDSNHFIEKSVWLIIYHKKSTVQSIYLDEAVEEALCFGWIDSKAKKRDQHSYYVTFTPRNARSGWSNINKERVKKLIQQGLMTEFGQKLVDIAIEKGTWFSDSKAFNLQIPDDLLVELEQNETALKNFNSFPASSKKMMIDWINDSKKPETRLRRIEKVLILAAENSKLNILMLC